MKQMPLALTAEMTPSFDNFISGENLECLTHLQNGIAKLGSGKISPPVYLWGGQGVGKTHLLLSVASLCAEAGLQCGCIDRHTPEEEEIKPNWSVILIDDCELLTQEQQARAFRAFIDAQSYGIWVVAAGAVAPIALQVREDLRTRLGWGHVFALKPLSDEELQAAIWHNCHSRGLSLSQDVLVYLVSHFSRDMRSIIALLNRLDQYALSAKRSITIPLIKAMLQEEKINVSDHSEMLGEDV